MTQQQFYHSKAWRRLSRAFLLSQNYICKRCGKPADIAHHRRYITPQNVNDPDITLNPASLEALCIECHNAEHFGTGGAVVRGLKFTTNDDLRKEITI
jgi:5-methylcytosine-specific restriction endonuclease McrA